MKDILVVDSEIKLTMADIENIEATLKVKLPKDYKAFLLKYNGGHPIKDAYPIIEIFDFNRYGWGESAVYDCGISWFYSIYDGEYNNFVQENKYKIDRYIPDELIIIGCSSGGDEICIGVEENNFGKVYYWGHDWERGEGCLSFVLVANNFPDFINSLYKFIDLKKDIHGEETWIYAHDKYSLPFSTEAKKYGSIVTDFFAKASVEVEDYIIEETESTKDLLLCYEIKSKNKRYVRRINKTGEIIEEKIEEMN